jgi:hypothetical protein
LNPLSRRPGPEAQARIEVNCQSSWHKLPAVVRTFALLAHEHLRIPAQAPRPTFALDMSDEEREIMACHSEHWRPWAEPGQMVIFGPVLV